MDMNLDQLASLVEIARTGHFTRAAEHLYLAQPTVSRQISALESELGVQLFHRARGHVTLTLAGERLMPIARRMLADADSVRTEMADISGLRRGKVRLGATPSLCASLVVGVVTDFRERHPGIRIEIRERGSRTLLSDLVDGALDLALIVTSVSSGPARDVIGREPVLHEQLVVASAADRPSPFGDGPVTLPELAVVPQIVFPDNYDLRSAVEAALRRGGLEPTVAVAGVEMDTALRFAERGIGVVVVPAMVAADRPALRIHRLADAGLSRTVSIARRSDMTPTNAAVALQSTIRAVAGRMADTGLVGPTTDPGWPVSRG